MGALNNLQPLRDAMDGNRAALVEALGLRRDGGAGRYFCPICQADGKPHVDGDFSVEAGFRCHKCGWSGDGFSLIQSVRGCDFPAAVEFARGVYGVAGDAAAVNRGGAVERKQGKTHAGMDEAARAACWSLEQKTGTGWKETRRDIYRDAAGDAVAAVLRFDRADGATDQDGKPLKQYRPIHAVEGGGWRVGDPPGQWPLFNLPELLAADSVTIHVVEGEKAALAGASIGLTCTTSAHGAKSPSKTDWSALRNRAVAIHPDNDDAGIEYAEAAARLIHAAGAQSVKIVPLPGLHKKGDMADFIAMRPSTAPESIRAKVEALIQDTPLWVPAPEQETAVADAPPIRKAKAGHPYACTDLGNAERVAAYYGDQIRWDVARNTWRVWDGRRWAADSALKVHALAAETARNIRLEAAAAPSAGGARDIGRDLFNHAVRSESRDRLAAMLEVLKSRPGIAVSAEVLDADPWALNVLNGTIDLRTGELRPHNRADLITKLAPVEYRPGLRDERWQRFLESSTNSDAALMAFMQVAAGYTLTGDTSEEKLFIIYGAENSGKTTLLEALRAISGEYARTIQTDVLAKTRETRGGGAASPELAALAGARLAVGSEMEQGREMAEALAKNLTGGEHITARHLRAEFFDFTPQFKIWLAVNHCPRVSADDGGVWRRILRIGFDHTVPPEARDKTLKPYLRNPTGGAPAVLAWAVEGCLRWQREGLEIPEAVKRSTAAYRDESDPLATFFEDCVRFIPSAWTSWADIWRAYGEHAAEMGVAERYRVAPKRLQERLRQRDCVAERRMVGRGWRGVELQTDWQDGFHDGYDGYDGISERFSSNTNIRKELEKASLPSLPSCDEGKPLFDEGDAADLDAEAVQGAG